MLGRIKVEKSFFCGKEEKGHLYYLLTDFFKS